MSYQVLARKWRPTNFNQMVGQEHVLQALVHALDSQRLHHAYLFTGTRGVGKTTIARILARCLSCSNGITATPCGECGACTSIEQGRYVDLIEIDAASRTKVEDMRELLDNVQYAPTEGRFKIYLIDEVHMLSTHSFNALLKTLEEPPEHVKFLFATTDPQKLPITILSRCLQFNLKNMTPEKIVHHLQFVLQQEQVSAQESALWALARAADGSMRDALSLTDQAIAYTQGKLEETPVSSMLGTIDQKKVYRLLDTLVARDAKALLRLVAEFAEFSPDFAAVLEMVVAIMHRVAVEQAVPGAVDNSQGDRERISFYAQNLSAEDVQLYYQIALVSRKDLAITPDARAGFEMAMLRMMAFNMSPPSQAVTEDLQSNMVADHSLHDSGSGASSGASASPVEAITDVQLGEEEAQKKTLDVDEPISVEESISVKESSKADSNTNSDIAVTDTAVTESAPRNPPSETTVNQSPVEELEVNKEPKASDDQKVVEEVDAKVDEEIVAVQEAPSMAEGGLPNASSDDLELMEWPRQAIRLGLSGMTQNLMMNMVKEQVRGQEAQGQTEDVLRMHVESGHYRLLNDSHKKKITQALNEVLNWSGRVEFVDGLSPSMETPAMWRERMKLERLNQAKQNLLADPNVQQLIAEFDGRMLEESVVSLSPIE